MGKGDRKTKKGKIFMGSYGVRRPKSKNKTKKSNVDRPAEASKPKASKPKKAAPKKETAKKTTAKKTTSKSTTKKSDSDKKK